MHPHIVPAQNSKTTENLEFCDLWPYRRGHAARRGDPRCHVGRMEFSEGTPLTRPSAEGIMTDIAKHNQPWGIRSLPLLKCH